MLLGKRRLSLWILFIVALLFYLGTLRRFYVGYLGDDARDILAAQSLLQGTYSNFQLPGHPPLNFPLPGFPLLLTPFVALCAPHWEWLKFLPILITWTSILWVQRIWAPDLSPRALYALLGIYALNPTTLAFSGHVIADSSYLTALLITFWLLRQKPGPKVSIVLGLTVIAATLFRPEGILLVLSLILVFLWTRHWDSLVSVLVAGALWVAVLFGNYARTGSATGYLSLFKETVPQLSLGFGTLFQNSWALLKTLILDVLLGISFDPSTKLQYINVTVFVIAGMAMILTGYLRWLNSPRTPPELGLAAGLYFLLHLGVHSVWLAVDPHYLWPLLPMAGFFVAYGIDHLESRRTRTTLGISLAALMLCLYGWQTAYAVQETLQRPVENRLPQETLSWLRAQILTEAFLLTPEAATLTLYTNRHSIAFIGGSDPDDFRARLLATGVSDVLTSPYTFLHVKTVASRDPTTVWKHTKFWLQEDPQAYNLLYHNDRERTRLYHVKPAADFQKAYAQYRMAMRTLGDSTQNLEGTNPMDKMEAVLKIDAFPSALNAYGAAALLSGRHLGLARVRLEEAVRQRPGYAMAWTNLARVYARGGDRARARRAYKKAYESIMTGFPEAFLAPVILRELRTI